MNVQRANLFLPAAVLLAVGSLTGLGYNLAAPKGILSLTARPAAAQAAVPAGAPAKAPSVASTPAPAPAPAPEQAATGGGGSAPVTADTAGRAPHARKAHKASAKPAKAPKAAPAKSAAAPAAAPKPPVSSPAKTPAAPAATKPAATPAAPAPATPAAYDTRRQTALPTIEPAEARIIQLQHGAIIVDAREENVFALGHIPGAINLPEPDFDNAYRRLEKQLPKNAKIVVYCESESCNQAHDVCYMLINKGYTNIILYSKGWSAWEAADYPQEKSQ